MQSSQPHNSRRWQLGAPLAVLLVVLVALFGRSLHPAFVLFANDGPLGVNTAEFAQAPACFTGLWADLNSVGGNSGFIVPSLTNGFAWLSGPVVFAKLFAPYALFILGLSAWLFFRSRRFPFWACLLGAIAFVLNGDLFSTACWGLGTQTICCGLCLLAMAVIGTELRRYQWLKLVLAGFLVGLGVIEAFDIGALFSLFFASYLFYSCLVSEGTMLQGVRRGITGVILVAVFAAFISAQTLTGLIGTQIKGIAGTEQDAQTKAEKWDWATQWSLPKKEVLGLAVPGLFGYRMDTPDGGQYWGQVGRTPGWENHHQGFPRYIGNGYYTGILVLLLAAWALLQAAQRQKSIFADGERKWIWYWGAVAVVCLLLAFGRFAPFYQLVYALPYFSTIRNPAKFLFFVEFALVVLAAYGVEGLFRAYAARAAAATGSKLSAARPASAFDRQWLIFSGVVAGLGVIGWMVYAGSGPALERFLQTEGFGPGDAPAIARFSMSAVGWAVTFLLLSLGLVWAVMRGKLIWAGRNWSGILLCGLLIADLGRANLPWIVYWNYPYKYATNPVIDFLRNKPNEQRVAGLPFRAPPQVSMLDQMYRIEWAQHHFQYYNIQSLDIVQMSREPVDLKAYEGALQFKGTPESLPLLTRRWQLTNTRYLLGPAGFLDVLNTQVDPDQKRFRYAMRFDIDPKPAVLNPTQLQDFTAVANTNGAYAVFEFTGALPRVKLYSNWEISTNDQATLDKLASQEFKPEQTVLVSSDVPTSASTNNPGTVEFTSYAPKRLVLKADAKTPAVLLLNDRHDPNWVVTVDGQPASLLRCNYIMRGVYLTPGDHTVEFAFRPPIAALYVTLSAMGVGVVLIVWLVVSGLRKRDEAASVSR